AGIALWLLDDPMGVWSCDDVLCSLMPYTVTAKDTHARVNRTINFMANMRFRWSFSISSLIRMSVWSLVRLLALILYRVRDLSKLAARCSFGSKLSFISSCRSRRRYAQRSRMATSPTPVAIKNASIIYDSLQLSVGTTCRLY